MSKLTITEPRIEGAIENMLFYHLSRAYHQIGHQFHEAVRDNGLTLAEWRILANLHGEISVSYNDLAARTFLDPQSLADALTSLCEEGLCTLANSGDSSFATGTTKGTLRVQQLFDLGHEMEKLALRNANPSEREELMGRLKMIVSNTEIVPSTS